MNDETRKTISQKDWDDRLSKINVSKKDLNDIVMNFLVVEGYKNAAENFQKESGTKCNCIELIS